MRVGCLMKCIEKIYRYLPPFYIPKEDLQALISLSFLFKPKIVIELGGNWGRTAQRLLKDSGWIERYIGIEQGVTLSRYLMCQKMKERKRVAKYARSDPRFELILKENGSRDVDSVQLPSPDMVFIDGDHCAEGVAFDSQLIRGIVQTECVICWHDYLTEPGVSHEVLKWNAQHENKIRYIEGTNMAYQVYLHHA